MPLWTRNQVIGHRRSMGWSDLSDDQIDRVVAILNDALGSLDGLDDVSWIEPDIRFRAAHHD